MAARRALLVSAETFQDPTIRKLKSPSVDVRELAAVLADPHIGGFDVQRSIDEPSHEILRRIEEFYQGSAADDLLLLYLSGHGHRDASGRLYFVCTNTELRIPRSTSLPSALVGEIAQNSGSRRQVMIVDSCFSGAFTKGLTLKPAQEQTLTGDDFPGGGRGQVILTASAAFQYSFEGDHIEGTDPQPSLFTRHLVQGLRTGEADLNNDGIVDLDELYRYVHERTTSEARQTTQRWTFQSEGIIEFARNPSPRKSELSKDTRGLLEHGHSDVRMVGVNELIKLLSSRKPGDVLLATEELEHLASTNDSFTVRQAAAGALATWRESGGSSARPSSPPTPAPDSPAREKVDVRTTERFDVERFAKKWRDRGKILLHTLQYVNDSGEPFRSRPRVGDWYSLQLQPADFGFVTLLLQSHDGKWVLGYPGWRSPGINVSPGRFYRFPDDLYPFSEDSPEVDHIEFGSPGTERAVAICTPGPLVIPWADRTDGVALPALREEAVVQLLARALNIESASLSHCEVKVLSS